MWGVEVELHSLLTLELDRNKYHLHAPTVLLPEKKPLVLGL